MKGLTIIGVLALVLVAGAATIAARTTVDDEDEAIRATIQHYFEGGYEMRKAFHPDATMWYVREGQVHAVPIQEFLSRVEATAGQPQGAVTKSIVSIDRTGTAAVATLELAGSNATTVDYMALLKIDGTWKIVNKIFDRAADE